MDLVMMPATFMAYLAFKMHRGKGNAWSSMHMAAQQVRIAVGSFTSTHIHKHALPHKLSGVPTSPSLQVGKMVDWVGKSCPLTSAWPPAHIEKTKEWFSSVKAMLKANMEAQEAKPATNYMVKLWDKLEHKWQRLEDKVKVMSLACLLSICLCMPASASASASAPASLLVCLCLVKHTTLAPPLVSLCRPMACLPRWPPRSWRLAWASSWLGCTSPHPGRVPSGCCTLQTTPRTPHAGRRDVGEHCTLHLPTLPHISSLPNAFDMCAGRRTAPRTTLSTSPSECLVASPSPRRASTWCTTRSRSMAH